MTVEQVIHAYRDVPLRQSTAPLAKALVGQAILVPVRGAVPVRWSGCVGGGAYSDAR